MNNRETGRELVPVGPQARQPMIGREFTVNRRQQLHESNRNRRPVMGDQSNPPDIPTYDNPDSYRFMISSRRTDGRNSDSASSSSGISTAVSPGPSTLVSTGISTDQTTPSDPQTEFRLPGDDGDIRATSLDRMSQVNLSPVSTNSEYNEPVFMIGSDPKEKVPTLMALDTQASANLMDVDLQRELKLEIERCDQELVPLQTKTGKDRIKPIGIAKGVEWHFAQREKTFTSDFLVVDMKNYNIILGRKDIKRLRILKSGPGLERRTMIRSSSCA
ncbi:short chain dehydrogenase family protein [Aspergillus niger]|nr:short chain dehydrogenase family protein [Aspergillus niger]